MYFLSNGAEVTTPPGVSSLSFLGNSVADSGDGRDDCVVAQILDENRFLAIAGEWTRLHTSSTFPSPFTSWEWCWSWWRHFGSGRQLRIAIVRDGLGELVAVAPLYVTSERSPFLSRELRIIGDDGRDGEGMTDEPTLLLGINCRRAAVEALLRHLHSGTGSAGWDAGKLRVPTSRSIVDVDVADTIPMLPSWRIRWEEGSQVVSLPNSWPEFRRSHSRAMIDKLSY